MKEIIGREATPQKLAFSFLTFCIFVASLAFFWGWAFAVGVGYIILAHELGHLFAGWHRGYSISLPMFYPLIGARIILREEMQNADDEAFLGCGGPIGGFLATLPLCGIYLYVLEDAPTMATLIAASGGFHLINMILVRPLDGGRIGQVMGRWSSVLGILQLCVISYYLGLVSILFWTLVIISPKEKYQPTSFWCAAKWMGIYLALTVWFVAFLYIGLARYLV